MRLDQIDAGLAKTNPGTVMVGVRRRHTLTEDVLPDEVTFASVEPSTSCDYGPCADAAPSMTCTVNNVNHQIGWVTSGCNRILGTWCSEVILRENRSTTIRGGVGDLIAGGKGVEAASGGRGQNRCTAESSSTCE